ncbi:hypothetical protein BpHYR1_007431 [Brachionus plicatilis]|uniref:Uncharacterized protein n=1 Tax=Brachionus plicatilis TaxID=10195 RepID=A0A3M7PZB4_BRAPC|nr:hypothetical protein BpHYR1_007431 [Brachionus plicatilis]
MTLTMMKMMKIIQTQKWLIPKFSLKAQINCC